MLWWIISVHVFLVRLNLFFAPHKMIILEGNFLVFFTDPTDPRFYFCLYKCESRQNLIFLCYFRFRLLAFASCRFTFFFPAAMSSVLITCRSRKTQKNHWTNDETMWNLNNTKTHKNYCSFCILFTPLIKFTCSRLIHDIGGDLTRRCAIADDGNSCMIISRELNSLLHFHGKTKVSIKC